MFEPFGQSFPATKAASIVDARKPFAPLARIGIWTFWLLVAAVVLARVALVMSGSLFTFAS